MRAISRLERGGVWVGYSARLDRLLDEIGEIGETDCVRKITTSVVLAVRVDRGG